MFTFNGDLWIEAACRTSRPTTLTFKAWDAEECKSVKYSTPIEADRWTTVSAPLRDFCSSKKSKTLPEGPCSRFSISADQGGSEEAVELLVDNVRFILQPTR